MKKILVFSCLVLMVGVLFAGVDAASSSEPRTFNIGTHPVGNLTNVGGTAVAAVVNKHSSLKLKVKAVAGPTTWLPMMNTKEIEFGLFVSADADMAYHGKRAYKKLSGAKGFPIRLVATGMVLSLATVVPGNSPAKTLADLKGLRVCGGFANVPSARIAQEAALANAGLTWADVKMVPVPHPGAAVKAVMEGRADAGWAAVGMPAVRELAAKRGARFLGIDISPQAVARKDKIHPYSFPKLIKGGRIPGADVDTWVMGIENYVVSRADIPDSVIYEMNEALWNNIKELGTYSPILKSWTQKSYASKKLFIPYHPASIKFLKEKGLWTDELEARQKELLMMKK